MTPEGQVKAKISAKLKEFAPDVWYNMPVPAGYGAPTLDYVGCAFGRFFAIEAKAPGKEPTERQDGCIFSMREAGGEVFVIDGPEGVNRLQAWLISVREENSWENTHGAE